MNHNILILSVGKRVELVKEFQQELRQRYAEGRVLTTDINPLMAPAAHVSDGYFTVPRATAPDYVSAIMDICINQQVRLVIPTIDTELLVLSRAREEFRKAGVVVAVAAEEFVSQCRDKRLTPQLLSSLGIKVPSRRDIHAPVYPMFAKPYDGSLSRDTSVIAKPGDITEQIRDNSKLIFMELIDKEQFREYTLDMYYGRDNRVKAIVPRERIEVRAGEINKGRTCKNWIVDFVHSHMDHLEGVIGPIGFQLFANNDTHELIGIEINPRFCGGYPLAYHAGANFPRLLIEEYMQGLTPQYSQSWQDNKIMLRYDSHVII